MRDKLLFGSFLSKFFHIRAKMSRFGTRGVNPALKEEQISPALSNELENENSEA
jgi:hypothetical protein